MSRILIWKKATPGSDIDIFGKTDYSVLDYRLKEIYGNNSPNWGNKLWYQGIYSEIDTPENTVTIRTTESIDEINDQYDLIIYPMANFFCKKYVSDIAHHLSAFNRLRIPVYIIACGAQAAHYGDIESLVQEIGDSSSRFIEAVYRTGGEFALRGEFTKEFFTRLGFHKAVVTGCPSIFQMGPDIRVSLKKVPHNELKSFYTGKIKYIEELMARFTDSVYLSQDQFEECLYQPGFFLNRSLKSDVQFAYYYSIRQAELLGQGRIKMIADTNDWYHYIRDHQFNYCLGTKLHGSIMSILAGVPTMMISVDSRTSEVAEYMNIPFVPDTGRKISVDDYYRLYDEMDYSKFNDAFQQRFHVFEDFLIEHKIVRQINTNNQFFKDSGGNSFEQYRPNQQQFIKYANKLKKERILLSVGKCGMNIMNRIKK